MILFTQFLRLKILVKSQISKVKSNFDFIPGINFAFLHLYASQTSSNRNEFVSNSFQNSVQPKDQENGSFLFSIKPRKLKDHIILMINNSICAVYSSTIDLIKNFEYIMILVELLRAYSISFCSLNLSPNLVDILPDSKFHLWGTESLQISSFIMSKDFILSKQVDLTKQNKDDTVSMTMIKESIIYQESAMITQSTAEDSEIIEYVASHFSSYENGKETPVKMLCSMKFRQTNNINPISILNEIHKLAEKSGLKEGSYYAVLYCSSNVDINSYDLPKGSIVVGRDTLLNVLHTFGASCVLDLVV